MSLFRRRKKPQQGAGDAPRPSSHRDYDARSMNEYLRDVPVADQPIAIIHWLIDDE